MRTKIRHHATTLTQHGSCECVSSGWGYVDGLDVFRCLFFSMCRTLSISWIALCLSLLYNVSAVFQLYSNLVITSAPPGLPLPVLDRRQSQTREFHHHPLPYRHRAPRPAAYLQTQALRHDIHLVSYLRACW
ncbi:hypothetical protein BR93DRAFT_222101 [Coniochaeta sp. PMI_546]|nr:hypothetical protein BR93DRAFT_222101 [Coniochaeta sp. PMI_546]